MIKNECRHEWDKHTGVKADGRGPYYICNKCKLIMEMSEVIQLEALENQTKSLENQTKLAKHQMGFQKYVAVIAIIISFFALIVSIFN